MTWDDFVRHHSPVWWTPIDADFRIVVCRDYEMMDAIRRLIGWQVTDIRYSKLGDYTVLIRRSYE